jgi:hypothetical protein
MPPQGMPPQMRQGMPQQPQQQQGFSQPLQWPPFVQRPY